MVTQTITRIPPKKRRVISTDIRGGGAYTTYTEDGVVRRSFVGGGGRTAQDVRQLVEQREARERAEQQRLEQERLLEEKRQADIREALAKAKTEKEARETREKFQRRTREDVGEVFTYDKDIKTEPYIEERVVDTFKKNGKTIPITKTYYVDPTVTGKQFEREATEEEKEYFEEQTSVIGLEATEPITKTDIAKAKFLGGVTSVNQMLAEGITHPIADISEKTIGQAIDWKGFGEFEKETKITAQKIRGEGDVISARFFAGDVYEFVGGVGGTGLQLYKDQPIIPIGATAVGYGIGFGASALVTGATAVGGATAGTITQLGIATGGGILLYGAGKETSQQIKIAGDVYSKGGIFGTEAIKLAHIGAGAGAGAKGFQQTAGWWRTRGRDYVPLAKLTTKDVITGKESFPVAPTEQHLKLFTERVGGKYIETTGKPGGFHVAPDTFWRGKKGITGLPGTSELPGTYVSAYISPHFAKLGGKGSSYRFSLTSAQGLPGVAYIKPSKFRTVGFFGTQKYQIGGEGKWFKYGWKKGAKEGIIDIPKMKTEIEGVIRTDTGTYGFISGKKYTKIEGIRVPIDVFEYGDKGAGNIVTSGNIKLKGGGAGYSYPTSSKLTISPEVAGISLSSGKVKKSYAPTSITYAPKSSKISTISSMPSSITSSKYSLGSSIKGTSISSSVSSRKSKISSRRLSSMSSALSSGGSSISTSSYGRTPTYAIGGLIKGKGKKRKREGLFGVSERRFGKFRTIGKDLSLKQAISVGQKKITTGLGATFKITPTKKGFFSGGVRTPRGFRRAKAPLTFIEKRKFRISTIGEVVGLKRARKRRKKRK